MPELIDRNELLRRIYERFGQYSTKVIATVEEGKIIEDWAFLEPFLNAEQTIEAEPVRHGRWIPCSERLPEYGVDVLVYSKSWEDHIQVAHIQYDGIMWELSDGEFYFSQSDVTHWMPLPEPPESEVQNNENL